jgi:hypothetical protein
MNNQRASRHKWHPPTAARARRGIIYFKSIRTTRTRYSRVKDSTTQRLDPILQRQPRRKQENKETREKRHTNTTEPRGVHARPHQEQSRKPLRFNPPLTWLYCGNERDRRRASPRGAAATRPAFVTPSSRDGGRGCYYGSGIHSA